MKREREREREIQTERERERERQRDRDRVTVRQIVRKVDRKETFWSCNSAKIIHFPLKIRLIIAWYVQLNPTITDPLLMEVCL